MENLLLIFDEIDDAVAMLRAIWSRLLSFVLACGLFVGSILAAIHWPTVAALSLISLCVLLLLPARRTEWLLRFKTDP